MKSPFSSHCAMVAPGIGRVVARRWAQAPEVATPLASVAPVVTVASPTDWQVKSQQEPVRIAHCPEGQFIGGQSMRQLWRGEAGHMLVVPDGGGSGSTGWRGGIGSMAIGRSGDTQTPELGRSAAIIPCSHRSLGIR